MATNVPVDDLTAAARIRNAALEGFARDGVAATSIRSVAASAGVSPGLVQHHFPSKAALRAAVDAHVFEVVVGPLGGPREGGAEQVADELGRRITAVFRDHPHALRYLARALVDGDEGALTLFDRVVTLIEEVVREDARAGRLREDVDLVWARLHLLIYNVGAVLLEQAIDRQLPEPMRSPAGLERWRAAVTDTFRQGLYRPESQRRSASRTRRARSPRGRR